MPKRVKKSCKSNKDIQAYRKYCRQKVAACRNRKTQKVQDLQYAVNFHRAIFELPPEDFDKAVKSRKGMPRPVYQPPPEVMAKMTQSEISEWKEAARKRRRMMSQRELKRANDEMITSLEDQLAELKQMLNESKDEDAAYKSPAEPSPAKSSDAVNLVAHSKPNVFGVDGQINPANKADIAASADEKFNSEEPAGAVMQTAEQYKSEDLFGDVFSSFDGVGCPLTDSFDIQDEPSVFSDIKFDCNADFEMEDNSSEEVFADMSPGSQQALDVMTTDDEVDHFFELSFP